jgi:hypothetical protein
VPEDATYLLINRGTAFTDEYSASVSIVDAGGFSLDSDGTIKASAGEIGVFKITEEGLQAAGTIITPNGIKGDVQAAKVQTALLDFNGISSMAPGSSSTIKSYTYTISFSAAV